MEVSELKLLNHDDSRLKEIAKQFDFTNPPFDPIQFAKDLVIRMYQINGMAITAPQLGIPYRIFALRGHPQNIVCFNPRIITPSEEQIRLEESSATHPGLIVKVKRPKHCRVRFALPNGDMITETYTGLTARMFMQSVDNLDGIAFYTKANPIHRTQALKKWKKTG